VRARSRTVAEVHERPRKARLHLRDLAALATPREQI